MLVNYVVYYVPLDFLFTFYLGYHKKVSCCSHSISPVSACTHSAWGLIVKHRNAISFIMRDSFYSFGMHIKSKGPQSLFSLKRYWAYRVFE